MRVEGRGVRQWEKRGRNRVRRDGERQNEQRDRGREGDSERIEKRGR